MLKEFENKPINRHYILLDISGDINNPVRIGKREYYVDKDITNIQCTVYNTKTDRMSTKAAYLQPKSKRLYLKTQRDGRLYLDEFQEPNGLDIRVD